ncbi:unnamed protein product [Darwinula stevensoni]|uniref:Uncharacterized protein n=1 Tax=Darwinula stevensoni TaxID=69355 RepID=A0A7R8XA89_9CRUS|nr:unnamed protein product [Darwinula stevensoni]CAG0889997.1 unnamed protein product [Darwinula stevensoni]
MSMLSSKNPVQRVATRRAFRAAQQQPKTKFSQEEQEEMRRKTRAYSEKYRADRMAGKKIAYEDSSIMSDASTASITTGQRSTASSDTSKTFCNSPDPDLVVTEALQNLPRRLAGRDILKGLATELRRPLQQLSPKPSATPTMNVGLEELAPAVPEEEPAERVEKTFIVQVIPEDEEVEHVVQERTMGIRDATAGRSLHLSPNVTPSHYRNSEPSSMSPEMHVTPVEKTPQLPGRYGSKSHPLPSCIPANATVDVMPSIIKKAKEPRSTSINRLSQGVDTSRLQAIISSIVQREVQKFANVRSSMAEPSAAASSTKRSMDSRGSREESPGKDRSQSSPKRFKPSQSVHQMAACEEADDEQSSDEDSPLEQPSIPVKSSGCSESSHSMSLRTQRKSSNTSAAADVSLEVLEKSSKKQATLMESSTRQQEKNLSAAKQISIDWEESFESEDLHNKSSRVAGKSIVEKRRSSKTSILNSNPRVGSRASLRNRGDIHEHGTTTGNIQTSQESTKTSLTVSSFAISLETSELPTIENQSEDSTIVQESANDTNGHETTENEVTDNATLRERTDDATVRDTTDSIDTEETENETDACQMTNGTDLRSIDGTMRSGSRSLRSLQAVDYTGMLSFSEMEKDKAERRPNVRQMSQSSKLGSTLSSTVSFRKGKKAQEHQTVGKKGRRKEASLSQAQSSEERTLPEEDTRPPSEASGSTFYSPESGDDSDLDQVTITNRYSASLTSHTSESQMDVECQTTANEEGERAASPPPLENPLEKISFPERARSPSEESGSTFYSPESGDESDLDEVPVTNHYSVSHTTESHIDAQDGTETGTSEESAHQDNSPSNCARASSLVDDDDEDEDEAYQPGEGTLTEEGTSSGFHESEDGEGVEDSLATSISKRQGQSNGNSNSEEIDLSEYPEAVQACYTMGQDEGVSHETRGHRYVIEYPSSQELLGRDHLRTVGPDRGEPKQGDPYVMNYFRPSHGMVFSHFFINPGCSKPPRPIQSGNTVVAFVEVGVVQLTMGTSVPRTLHPSDVVILKPRIEYSLKNVGQSQAVLLMATMDYREMMKSFMREVARNKG